MGVNSSLMSLTAREEVLATVLQHSTERAVFTTDEIHDTVTGPSIRTVRNALNNLVEIGFLEASGGNGSAPRFYQVTETTDKHPQLEFIETSQVPKWTFQNPDIREWVESHLTGRVLNACAGKSTLNHDSEIVRNDLDETRDVDISVDVAELQYHLDHDSYDTIVFDPPYTIYQSNLRYKGRQVGHARRAKESFEKLLRPGGIVIELGYHGTCMPARLGFTRVNRTWFNTTGRFRDTLGAVDQKHP